MAKGAVVARIVSEYSDKGTRAATKDFKKLSGDTEGVASKISGTFKKIAAAAAVIEIAHIGIDAIKAAEVVNGAFAKMTTAFANTGSSLNQFSPQVQETVDKMGNLAFTAGDTADALARGAIAFHSATTALGNMSLAADLARTTGMTLSDAMVILGKAAQGKTVKALTALGVVMPKTGSAAEKFKSVTDQLTASLKGQADAYAQTHPIEVMKTKMEEVSVSIGQLLMPAFNAVVGFITGKLIPAMLSFINFLRQNPKYLQPVVDAFALFVNILAKVGVVVLDLVGAFLKVDSVILQVVRGIGWLTGNKAMQDWAKSAADGLGNASKSVLAASAKLDKFHMTAMQMKAVAPITVKGLGAVTAATTATAAATSKLTAEQLKSLAALKALGVTPTTSTDPIELEAARLNLVKQGNIAEAEKIGLTLAALDAQMQSNVAIQRYSDIMNVLADQHISNAEISLLATKWGMSQDAVVAYIAKVTGAAAFDPKDLGSPGAVASVGWKNALDALNAYYTALKTGTVVAPVIPGITPPGAQTPVIPGINAPALNTGNGLGGVTDTSNYVSSGISSFGASPSVTSINPLNGADRNGVGGAVVNVTVMGSVVTQADLVAGVANGLMQSQLSGTNYTVNMLNL